MSSKCSANVTHGIVQIKVGLMIASPAELLDRSPTKLRFSNDTEKLFQHNLSLPPSPGDHFITAKYLCDFLFSVFRLFFGDFLPLNNFFKALICLAASFKRSGFLANRGSKAAPASIAFSILLSRFSIASGHFNSLLSSVGATTGIAANSIRRSGWRSGCALALLVLFL